MAGPAARCRGRAGATRFDVVANLLGYLPLGALLCGARAAQPRRAWRAALASRRSAARRCRTCVEVAQNFLPTRVPSLLDWALNVAGALAGALLGLWLARARAASSAGSALRERWFVAAQRAAALVLLLLWPLGLLFPAPVPLGLGQVWERTARAAPIAAARRHAVGRRLRLA